MTEYPSQQYRRIYYEEFREHLTQWDWMWHASLTFLPETSFDFARQRFRRWRLDLIDEEDLQLGIFYIISHKREHKHLHALIIGRNRQNKTLLDCSTQRWEAAWRHISTIEEIDHNEGICDYAAQHFLGFKSDWFDYDFYGRTLLRQEKIPHIEGDNDVDIL